MWPIPAVAVPPHFHGVYPDKWAAQGEGGEADSLGLTSWISGKYWDFWYTWLPTGTSKIRQEDFRLSSSELRP